MALCKGNTTLKLYCGFMLSISAYPLISSLLAVIFPQLGSSVIHNICKRNIAPLSMQKGQNKDESDHSAFSVEKRC